MSEDLEISYENVLKAGGLDIVAFKEFGSYQGQWAAIVKKDGKIYGVKDWYGSCSHCDGLQSELGYGGTTWGELYKFYVDSAYPLMEYDEAIAAGKWDAGYNLEGWFKRNWPTEVPEDEED